MTLTPKEARDLRPDLSTLLLLQLQHQQQRLGNQGGVR
jgi:hypothetical protein